MVTTENSSGSQVISNSSGRGAMPTASTPLISPLCSHSHLEVVDTAIIQVFMS